MTANDFRIPAKFMGAIRVAVSTRNGDALEQKAIGLELVIDDETRQQPDGQLSCEVCVDFFIDPPYLSMSRVGTMVVDNGTKTVQIHSPHGFSFQGKFADDFQSIKGSVSLGKFQLLDVDGEFNDQPIVFQVE